VIPKLSTNLYISILFFSTGQVPKDGHSILPNFFENFFYRAHGVGKLAKKELRKFVISLKHWYDLDRRAELFAVIAGVARPDVYSEALGDFFMRMMKRIFHDDLKSLAEKMDKYDSRAKLSNFYIPRKLAIKSIIGLDSKRKKASTWDAPELIAISSNGAAGVNS
jgi:hypothetical protein